jgi:hypothetical protein
MEEGSVSAEDETLANFRIVQFEASSSSRGIVKPRLLFLIVRD